MTDITIPDAAVEAAHKAVSVCICTPYPMGDGPERDCPTHGEPEALADAGVRAAAPHIAAQVASDIHGQFGVNVSDEMSDWWDGYRQAQRDVLRKLREIEAYYRIEADHG